MDSNSSPFAACIVMLNYCEHHTSIIIKFRVINNSSGNKELYDIVQKEVSISKYNTLWPVIIRLSNFQLSVSTNFCDFILIRRNLILAIICHLKGILNKVYAYNLFISCVSIVVHACMYIIYLGNWHSCQRSPSSIKQILVVVL